ncbi:MAG: toll/interleukin-1 receptor domain-containing protein [Dehalococcoidia bacterium]|nr:MAG: toll/interleukin-1 receptor domain-containing protein [Dehalococcoidia bacterium]
MSVDTCRRQIESANRELGQLHQKLAAERRREADKVARIGQIERGITKSTSVSSLQSKAREIERLNKDIEQSKKKQADLSEQIAAKEKKKHDHERDLHKEQGKEQQALQKDQERRMAQFEANLRRSLTEASSQMPPTAMTQTHKEHDVFISHASEDKESFVRALAEGLRARGVNVWYDEFELKVGDSLRRSIDRGLVKSRFGIVVFSSAFFAKNWPQYELDGLVTKETSSGGKVILPIWHKVSKDEVAGYSPTLADKVALNTGIQSLDEIIEELVAVICPTANSKTADDFDIVSTVPSTQE